MIQCDKCKTQISEKGIPNIVLRRHGDTNFLLCVGQAEYKGDDWEEVRNLDLCEACGVSWLEDAIREHKGEEKREVLDATTD